MSWYVSIIQSALLSHQCTYHWFVVIAIKKIKINECYSFKKSVSIIIITLRQSVCEEFADGHFTCHSMPVISVSYQSDPHNKLYWAYETIGHKSGDNSSQHKQARDFRILFIEGIKYCKTLIKINEIHKMCIQIISRLFLKSKLA